MWNRLSSASIQIAFRFHIRMADLFSLGLKLVKVVCFVNRKIYLDAGSSQGKHENFHARRAPYHVF